GDGAVRAETLEAPADDLVRGPVGVIGGGAGEVGRRSSGADRRRCLLQLLADQSEHAVVGARLAVVARHDEGRSGLDAVLFGETHARAVALVLHGPDDLIDARPELARLQQILRLLALLAGLATRELLLDHRDMHRSVRLNVEFDGAQGPRARLAAGGRAPEPPRRP